MIPESNNTTSVQEKELPEIIENEENETPLNKDPKLPVSNFSLSSIALKKAANKINRPQEIESDLPKDSFELQTLEKFWKHYTEEIRKKGKQNMAAILSMYPIDLQADHLIQFTVANELNKVEFEREMELLLPYLRKELNNFSIKITTEVAEIVKEENIYTLTEKYQHLLKVNPALEVLRKNFDLDF